MRRRRRYFLLDQRIIIPPVVCIIQNDPQTSREEVGHLKKESGIAEGVDIKASCRTHGPYKKCMEMVGGVDE